MIREFQKIYSRRTSTGLLFAAVFFSVLLSAFFIHDYTYEVTEEDGTVYVQGRKGVWAERRAMEKIPTELCEENLNASLYDYRRLVKSEKTDKANRAFDKKYPGWRILFEYAYIPEHKVDDTLLQKLQHADDFYKNIPVQLYENMKGYDGQRYSRAEKNVPARCWQR